MTYNEAYKLGSRIEGYVKCTYAKLFLYEYDGAVFSLQKSNVIQSTAREDLNNSVSALPQDTNVDGKFTIIDIPVVQAAYKEDIPYENQLVPVKLTKNAAAIIKQLMGNRGISKFGEEPKGGWGYARFRKGIQNNDTFYVKACAIDWIPTDFSNASVTDEDGNVILLTDALKEAEKKLASAKALLAVAGASTIL